MNTRYSFNKHFDTNEPRANIVHVTLGSLGRTIAELERAQKSYHFLYGKNGTVFHMEPTDKGAWHAGRKNDMNERAAELFTGVNPNKYSIGHAYIGEPLDEHGNITYDWKQVVDAEPATDAQVQLCAEVIEKYGMGKPVLSHREIARDKLEVVNDFRDRVIQELERRKSIYVRIFRLLKRVLALREEAL